ncbi:MAG: hypothetical protein U0R80_00325 [Nocardioidaceae bacterium]
MSATTRTISSALGLSALLLGSGGLTTGASASAAAAAAVPTCELTVHSNKVLELQDNDGDDEIYFKLGAEKTPTRVYAEGQKRRNIGSEFFQGSIDVKIFERDGNNLTLVGTLSNIPCENEPGDQEDVAGAGALYTVRWSVD